MTRHPSPADLPKLLLKPLSVYILILFGISAFYLLSRPIVAGDTDLWYHLNGGRYILEHQTIPRTSFFSFVTPPRQWVDYYWLFQVLVYSLYTTCGYYGLIALRAGLYFATAVLLFVFLLKGPKDRQSLPWCALLAALGGVILLPRAELVRPHLFSYLFIMSFLYICECRPQKAMVLPILAILWTNLHGIVYPVLLLVCGAYGLEAGRRCLRRKESCAREDRIVLAALALSMLAPLLTPHGLRLLKVPFQSLAYASHTIMEFRHLTIEDLLSFGIATMIPSFQTFVNLIGLLSGLVLLNVVTKRQLRISHFLLYVGGLVLLANGVRFVVEWTLLSLPLLKSHPLFPPDHMRRTPPTPLYLVLEGMLMVMPLMFVQSFFAVQRRYPVSYQGLPHGVATFLNRIDAGGNVLNHPNTGGYLQWRLYPRYRIFMDMEVPFLFTTEDLQRSSYIFVEEEALRNALTQYDPSFITVPADSSTFGDLIKKFPEYVVVFFDDFEVLYVNSHHHPSLAKRYELKGVDPFKLRDQPVDEVIKDQSGLIAYLPRLLELDPECAITNYLAGKRLIEDGAYDRALPFAEALIRGFPELPSGYRLQGEALAGLKLFDRAITAYQMAIERANEPTTRRLYKKIGSLHLERGEYAKAYKALRKTVDIYSARAPLEDLANLSVAALRSGKTKEGQTLLRVIYAYKASPQNQVQMEQLRNQLAPIGVPAEGREGSKESFRDLLTGKTKSSEEAR